MRRRPSPGFRGVRGRRRRCVSSFRPPGFWSGLPASRGLGKALDVERLLDRSRGAGGACGAVEICISRTAAPALPEATYYHHDILGLTVQTEAGEGLGEIVDIWPSAAHDLYVVRRDAGEWLLPAVRAFILRVDL